MKSFRCSCGQLLFFENTSCTHCDSALGFLPDTMEIAVLEGEDDDVWQAGERQYKKCLNYSREQVCNWMVPSDDPCDLCLACRLNEVIPDLSLPDNRNRWRIVEMAKRRLVYTLIQLNLPIVPKSEDAEQGLAFRFLADKRLDPNLEGTVLTGHANGIVTINLAEADDVEREKARARLGEPFRTMLGHFRHEIGHYYWDRLIKDSESLPRYREIFGDETADYGQALEQYYRAGAPPDWNLTYISAYATMHPWEDWAETWAHYLHIHDTLETAHDVGLQGQLYGAEQDNNKEDPFEVMMQEWDNIAVAINSLNRSLGLRDGYPFIVPEPVFEKLRFIREVVHA